MASKRQAFLVATLMAALPATGLALPGFKDVKAAWRPSDVVVLDRLGQPLQRVRVDKTARRLDWVRIEDTSPTLRHALVLSEDKRFYEHSGVDWQGVAAAAWGNLWNTRTRGASTLTMQLAGLLDEDFKAGRDGRSVWQKVGQGWSASWLEARWSKAEILEAYLNLVSFRGELVGLGAMSAALFGKLPGGLNAEESAIAVALLRAPNAPADRVAARACRLLKEMKTALADCARVAIRARQALSRKNAPDPLAAQLAPHFALKLVARQKIAAGARVASTIDAGLQRYATATLRRHLAALAERNVQDGAAVVLDNASGDILAWIGSSGSLSAAAEVDGVTAPRQAGSTLKPFLYQLAIDGRWLTAASLLDDSPLDLQTASGLYAPQNYAKDFKGLVSVRTALASSLNVPAVRTIEIVSPMRLRDRLYELGLTSLVEDGDYYGYSLALGAADIRLIDLANAYRTLANQGLYSAMRWTWAEPRSKPIRKLDAATSFIIADILSDRTARARTFGLESALSTRYWSAVKTGTSKDMRDNWAVGFSRRHTVAVWVGNASGEPMWDVSGMHGAAPVWLALLDRLQRSAPPQPPTAPAGVTRRTVRYQDGVEAGRHEWFLAGTERELIVAERDRQANQPAGIAAPLDGSVFALDPDIPPANQRLLLRARGLNGATWRMDGKMIGRGVTLPWMPWPGRHSVELRDENGKVWDRVTFSVRGAFLKRPPGH